MTVDVTTAVEIGRPVDRVYSFVADPLNAPIWYANIERAEWRSDAVLAVGARILFVARFLGRRLAYIYEVTDIAPGERLVMATADGPFPMETSYTTRPLDGGGTALTLRNRGEPAGFATVAGPLVAPAMRRANRKDLARLRRVLEDPDR